MPEPRIYDSSYKIAAGISYTAIKGNEAALKAKYFVNRNIGFEAHAGSSTGSEVGYQDVYLAVIWQPHLEGMGLLRPFVGVGPALLQLNSYPSNYRHLYGQPKKNNFYGVFPFGLEFSFASLPVALSLDCQLPFVKLTSDELSRAKAYTTVGFGAKYLVR
ncbi:hypothetical protein [Botryobacter ruber]|uniref:hypothetical protein n=1 Tax=Botryobacter ruber TaxID=2171629 RepID=UPI000E0C2B76|nr:hypothetical protein [Botryobacter ruber]